MMQQILQLAPLLATLVLRQALVNALRQPVAGRPARGGRASIVGWYVAYFAIFALALCRLWSEPLASQPWGGYLVIWIGIGLRLVSLRQIGAYYDVLIVLKQGHRLVDRGPYRFLRHPLHFALHLEMAGLAILAGAAAAWMALALSLVILAGRNVQEERALEAFFGAEYRAYRRRAWDIIDLLPGSRKP
jgi:protein-S-isoprenylcysteine O-methyltransferase Ste14